MWSVPMVAVAMNFTAEPSNNSALHLVLVLMTRASASFTSAAQISSPGMYFTLAYGSKTPSIKGMALSATILNLGLGSIRFLQYIYFNINILSGSRPFSPLYRGSAFTSLLIASTMANLL